MTKQDVFDLMDRFERSSLSTLRVAQGEFELELGRSGGSTPAAPAAAAPTSEPESPEAGEPTVNAPLVGCFYAAPGPDQPPFVQVGDRVAKGQTLCLMEAMKMMSEIPAPCDCVIQAVLKENGALASFGEPLFRYRAV